MASSRQRLADRLRRAGLDLYRRAPIPVRRVVVRLISPTFTAGAAVVIRRPDGAILLVKQRHTGAWALPGGLLHRGEAAADAVIREVSEEVGITLDPVALGTPMALLEPHKRTIDVIYQVDADSQPPQRNDRIEVTGIGWFALDALPPITDPTAAIVAKLRGN